MLFLAVTNGMIIITTRNMYMQQADGLKYTFKLVITSFDLWKLDWIAGDNRWVPYSHNLTQNTDGK